MVLVKSGESEVVNDSYNVPGWMDRSRGWVHRDHHQPPVVQDGTGVSCCFNADLMSLSNPVGLTEYLSAEHPQYPQNETLKSPASISMSVRQTKGTCLFFRPQLSPVIATGPKRIAECTGLWWAFH